MNNETNSNVTETETITTDMNCNIDETVTESFIVSPVSQHLSLAILAQELNTYEQKMDFLAQIRKEVGLDKVGLDKVDDIYDVSSQPNKYITEYTFGTI